MATQTMEVPGLSQPGKETQRLRLYFLLPLVIAILITELVPIVGVYLFTRRSVGVGGVHLRMSALELYNYTVDQDAHALETVIDVLGHDQDLREALARKDRAALLAHAAPMYARMQRTFGVSHFYFSGPDRVNLLRVHAPDRYGDVIDRVTTRLAARTGATAHGVELGPIGTFTLRVVTPWFDERRRLLGFVELGMETTEVMERVRKSLAAHSLILINKKYLDRAAWEEGMRVFGRTPKWDQFPNSVVASQSIPDIPPALAERIAHNDMITAPIEPVLEIDRGYYRPVFVPIQDVGRLDVATVVLLVDVSPEVNIARLALLLGGIAYLAGGILLFALFYRLVGWIGGRIEHNEQKLEQLAAIDHLTGLYNRRMHHTLLNSEIARAQRYGHPLSILMLDIDHFKRVNDSYGHLVGDQVLARLGTLLRESVRSENTVCRYGGEEFTVIVPELGANAAAQMAERLREIIAQSDLGGESGRDIRVSVSIGVAAFPESAVTAEQLTRAADTALYAAKAAGRNRVSQFRKRAQHALPG